MAKHVITVAALHYRYGAVEAVRGINFQVKEGEIFGFLGPNGAGKSTTIKILTGQLRPQDGKTEVLSLDIRKHTKKIQEQIGICFEKTNLYEQMTGLENLKLFAALYGVKGFDPLALLKKVDLLGREKELVSKYSKGMKQRLMMARALVNRPALFFLDEPTDGLDPVSAENIRNVIREERKRGAAVFLTTHDMLEADKLCDRVAFINQGTIVALDTPHNLKQEYGRRMLKAEVKGSAGSLEYREITLDRGDTAGEVAQLFSREQVVTLHSAEASLEDIFCKITGRGLAG